jgi:Tfp pilus tip-associated adhesin PilY1
MKPAVSLDDSGRLWIYVGTGRYFCGNDNICCGYGNDCPPVNVDGTCPAGNDCSIVETGASESKFMAVGIFDRYWDSESQESVLADTTLTLSDLDHRIVVTGAVPGHGTGYAIVDDSYPAQKACHDVCPTCKGWYLHLLEERERCLGDFLAYGEIVFFLTYRPAIDPNDPCSGGGTSNLYGVYYKSGTSATTPVFDLNGDGIVGENDQVMIAGHTMVSPGILKLTSGFAGGSPIALAESLYLPLGQSVAISPPGIPYETGVTSWKELFW